MTTEHARFLALFDALAIANTAWMARTPPPKWDWVPFDNPHMKFGDRISTITIRSVYIHTIVGEVIWADTLGECAEGARLGPDHARSKALTQELESADDLVNESMRLHTQNMQKFSAYDAATLSKPIQWVGRDWTVMGFLWGIYSHRSYHLGNIDILMREADENAPDFFSNFQQQMA